MLFLQLRAGEQIYYELIAGNPARPYLIFLHEGLGSVDMWKEFPAQLCQATGCPGLLYDRLGYGRCTALTARRRIHYLHDDGLREWPQCRRIAAIRRTRKCRSRYCI